MRENITMIKIGNCTDWINPDWVHEILNDTNKLPLWHPTERSLLKEHELTKLKDDGYDTAAVHWWQYTKSTVNFDLTPPPFITREYHWWIVKLLPGNFLPMHVDPCGSLKNSTRYWIPFQDWELGHVFMYNDRVLTNYKFGDIWQFENAMESHGSANIGKTPRIVLQITEYDK